MVNPEASPYIQQTTLVEFEYSIVKIYITDAEEDLVLIDGTYLSDSLLSVKLPKNSLGGFEKTYATITMSLQIHNFASQATSGRAFAPAKVKVKEIIDGEIKTLYVGRMSSAHRNTHNKKDTIEIKVKTEKSDLDQSLGFSCNATCGWVFGDSKTCKYNLQAKKESGFLTINDTKTTTVDIALTSTQPLGYWDSGEVQKDSIRIKIRAWDGNNRFYLNKLPPPTWHGTYIDILPGCNKTPTDCRSWDNEERFSGIGLAALSYNPIFENPNNPYQGKP